MYVMQQVVCKLRTLQMTLQTMLTTAQCGRNAMLLRPQAAMLFRPKAADGYSLRVQGKSRFRFTPIHGTT